MGKRSKRKKMAEDGQTAKVSVPVAAPASVAAPQEISRLNRDWMLGLGLILAVLLVYQPAWHAGFVWDDDLHLTANPCIIGPFGLKEIWTTGAASICPLTLTTFWLEHKLWGLAPLPYHLVNVLMHGACAVVLWRVLRGLQAPGAWLGAALWALHPVQVESVAWITEMKNTQSGLFFLLAILFYLKWLGTDRAGRGSWNGNYALTLLFAAMAMASKSSTVILPVVLGLGAWWVKSRWRWRTLIELSPIFLMSLAAGTLTIWTQGGSSDGEQMLPMRSWPERLVTAGDAVWFYLRKLAWPHPLIAIYPRWEIDPAQGISYLPLLAVIMVVSGLWLKRGSWARVYFFVFAFFLAALLPVLGLINNSFYRFSFVADHFQYLASMGPLALAGAGIVRLAKVRWRLAIGGGILVLLGILSWRQASIYKNEHTLWNYALAWNPQCWPAHEALGVTLVAEGKTDEGIAHYVEALKLNPNYVDALYNLGVALDKIGQPDEAMAQYRKAISINPRFAKAYMNIGFLLGGAGKMDEAIGQFRKSLEINPDFAEARYNLGVALFQKGERDEAVDELKKAVKLKPDYIAAYTSLGVALAQMRRTEESAAQFRKILEIDPNNADAHNNLGIALTQQGRVDEAIAEYQAALKIKPSVSACDNLGTLLLQAGRFEAAAAQFREALRLNPADATAQKNLAEAKRRMSRGRSD